ncbi:MAG TPA: hypothetical protein VL243_12505 [Vicinamibacterales bacterium]|nr:hypothetical protein [Vicinamibacterales bacterium]
MANTDKAALVALLDRVREELNMEPETPLVTQALHQCERLRQALLQFHAEGLRFAAFTLSRLMQQPGANLRESTQTAGRQLKEALDAAGYTSQH